MTASRRLHGSRPLVVTIGMAVLLAILGVPSAPARGAVTGLTDCRFSKAQVFDVQWNISGSTLSVSGMTRPYASNEPRTGQLAGDELADTDTFAFFTSGSADSEVVGFQQFASGGSLIRTLHLSGTFRAIGPDFIFYLGDGFWGTLITSGQGFSYGDSASLEVTAQNVPIAEALAYTSCADIPLTVGQSRSSLPVGGGGPVADSPPPAASDPLEPVVELAIEQSSGLSGVDSLLVRDGAVVPVTTTLTPSAGPSGGLVIEDGSDTLTVTVTSAGGVSPTNGVIVAPDGEIVCEICAQLAAGLVVEAWIYSTPRLAAAVRVDVEDGICPLLRIPVGTPLDGAGPIAPGLHTLQIRMITDAGYEILSIPITIGTSTSVAVGAPVPTRVNTGGGPVPIMPLPLALGLLIATAGLLLIQRERQLAWEHAWATRPRRTRTIPGRRLTAFDELAQRLDAFRQEQRR